MRASRLLDSRLGLTSVLWLCRFRSSPATPYLTCSSMVLKCDFSNARYDSSASGVVGMYGASCFEGFAPPSRPGRDHVLLRRFTARYDSRPAMFAAPSVVGWVEGVYDGEDGRGKEGWQSEDEKVCIVYISGRPCIFSLPAV